MSNAVTYVEHEHFGDILALKHFKELFFSTW